MGRDSEGLLTRRVKNPKTGVWELTTYSLEETDIIDANQPTPEQELQAKRAAMVLTPCQFLDGLEQSGKIAQAQVIIVDAPYQVKNKFKRATQYERLHPMTIEFGAYLWPVDTEAELDNFFILAATL